MRMSGRTIFITGGTSGIGRGLAEAFHARGNQVLITGRRSKRLQEICAERPGIHWFALDVTSAASVRDVARRAVEEFPAIDCVINNAGVLTRPNFAPGGVVDECAITREVGTNLLGPIRVAQAFLPHLVTRPGATLVNVSSALAFVPFACFPIYCATKAALHSWTLSLRHQLRGTSVTVIELVPPYVATELGGADKPAAGADAMPLDDFVSEAMRGLETDADEIAIAEARRFVTAGCGDIVRKAFAALNSRIAKSLLLAAAVVSEMPLA